jgi:hypothetical protein
MVQKLVSDEVDGDFFAVKETFGFDSQAEDECHRRQLHNG